MARQVLILRPIVPEAGWEPGVIAAHPVSEGIQAGDPGDLLRIDQVTNPDSGAICLVNGYGVGSLRRTSTRSTISPSR